MFIRKSLEVPPEPQQIKEFISVLRTRLIEDTGINWDSLAVWGGNKIPQYLWNEWREQLVIRDFTWQKFLRLIKYQTSGAILWAHERITWERFVKKIIDDIEGPLGKALVEK